MKKRSERILRSERGFTLVELGVALAIMAILTMIAYPTYKNIKNRAYEAEAWAIMQEIRVDVWTDYLENEKFPSNLAACVSNAQTRQNTGTAPSGCCEISRDLVKGGDFLLGSMVLIGRCRIY